MIQTSWRVDRLSEDFVSANPRKTSFCSDERWADFSKIWINAFCLAYYTEGLNYSEARAIANRAVRRKSGLMLWLLVARLIIEAISLWWENRGEAMATRVGMVKSIQSASSLND